MKEKLNLKWLYWFTFSVAVIFVYKTLDNLNDISIWVGNLISILMPFFMGILLAYLLYIPCRAIEKIYRKSKTKIINKRARGLSVITVFVLAILLITMAINLVIPTLSRSIVDLANDLPEYYQNSINFVNNLPEESILNKINIRETIAELQKIDITKIISLENISDYIKGVMGVASTIFSIFVSLIMSVYFLLERREILKFFNRLTKALFKTETCKAINKYFSRANDIFFKFISSQVIDAIIVGILVSIAMWILGVKYWVLLGFMIGLFNIIPYFGAIVGVAIATVITIFTGGFNQALWMLLIVIVLQQIDANIINPKIVGNALKLSPILVIFSVTLFGAYFGVLGMFLAVPIIAVVKIMVIDFLEYRIKKMETEKTEN
jgi:predicted PurR-regulated permease PerM